MTIYLQFGIMVFFTITIEIIKLFSAAQLKSFIYKLTSYLAYKKLNLRIETQRNEIKNLN